MTFRSKVDAWLGAVMIGSAVLSSAVALVLLVQGVPGGVLLAVAIAVTGAILPLWILAHTAQRDQEYQADAQSIVQPGLIARSAEDRLRQESFVHGVAVRPRRVH
jgi:hypothetical protein